MRYCDNYYWETPFNNHVMGHVDGSVSLLISWQGIQNYLHKSSDIASDFETLRTSYRALPVRFTLENHFLRTQSSDMLDKYVNLELVRAKEVGRWIRETMAEHLKDKCYENTVYMVLHVSPEKWIAPKKLSAKKKMALWESNTEVLLEFANIWMHRFSKARVCTISEYIDVIDQLYNKPHHARVGKFNADFRYPINEQLIYPKPVLDDGFLNVDGALSKTVLMYNYPDLKVDWFYSLAALTGVEIHISQVIQPIDTQARLKEITDEVDDESITSQESASDRHLSNTKLGNRQQYLLRVAQNNLKLFKNVYIVTLHSPDKQRLKRILDNINELVSTHDGEIRSGDELQYHFFKISMPGMGVYCQYFREDECEVVTAMAPVFTFNHGGDVPDSIRLSGQRQIVAFDHTEQSLLHELVFAMTGGGKGTQYAIEIGETYPRGIDYFLIDFGLTYQWMFELLGGTYIVATDETTLNPLPPYECRIDNPKVEGSYLDQKQVASVLSGLTQILLGKSRAWEPEERTAASAALLYLYRKMPSSKVIAPILGDFVEAFSSCEYPTESAKEAGKQMQERLANFIAFGVGRSFNAQQNLPFHKHLMGIDLMEIPDDFVPFYYNFSMMQFVHEAYYSRARKARIIAEEIDQARKKAGDVVDPLISFLLGTGRKQGSFFTGISQGLEEMEEINSNVIANTNVKTLLAREGEDECIQIGRKLDLTDRAINIFKKYEKKLELPYRQCMRKFSGELYDLHLTFPEDLLIVASTKSDHLDLKESISRLTPDPFERIRLFKERSTS